MHFQAGVSHCRLGLDALPAYTAPLFAIDVLQKAQDVCAVQELFGHEDGQTTLIYPMF